MIRSLAISCAQGFNCPYYLYYGRWSAPDATACRIILANRPGHLYFATPVAGALVSKAVPRAVQMPFFSVNVFAARKGTGSEHVGWVGLVAKICMTVWTVRQFKNYLPTDEHKQRTLRWEF